MNHAGGKYYVKPIIPPSTGAGVSVIQVYNEYGYEFSFTVQPMPELYFSQIYSQFVSPYDYQFGMSAKFSIPALHTVSLTLYDENWNMLASSTANGTGEVIVNIAGIFNVPLIIATITP